MKSFLGVFVIGVALGAGLLVGKKSAQLILDLGNKFLPPNFNLKKPKKEGV